MILQGMLKRISNRAIPKFLRNCFSEISRIARYEIIYCVNCEIENFVFCEMK